MKNESLTLAPLVSIVIPSYNSLTLIEKCLRSVLNTDYPSFEVVVVDDCSTDGGFEFIRKRFGRDSRLKVIRNEGKLGPAATRNRGIGIARGEYIAFLETDMEVKPTWLEEIIKVLESDKSIGAAQSKVLDTINRKRIQAIGIYIVPYTGWVISRGFGEEDKGTYDYAEDVSIGAVGSVVRRGVLDKVGRFDDKLVHNIDDIDLGWRIWLGGFRIVSVPRSITHHWSSKPPEVRDRITPRLESEFHFNKVPRMFIKNYETKNLVKYLPWAVLILFLRGLLNLRRRDPVPLIGFLRAIIWNTKNLRDTLRERYRIQYFVRRVPDSYIMKKIMFKNIKLYWKYLSQVKHMSNLFA